jgi:hypothetical protein
VVLTSYINQCDFLCEAERKILGKCLVEKKNERNKLCKKKGFFSWSPEDLGKYSYQVYFRGTFSHQKMGKIKEFIVGTTTKVPHYFFLTVEIIRLQFNGSFTVKFICQTFFEADLMVKVGDHEKRIKIKHDPTTITKEGDQQCSTHSCHNKFPHGNPTWWISRLVNL